MPAVLVLLVVSRGMPSESGIAYLIAIPALAAQEAVRGGFIGSGRAMISAWMDLTWLLLMGPTLLGVSLVSNIQPGHVVLVWTATGSISLLFGYGMWIRHPAIPHPLTQRCEKRKDLYALASSAMVAGSAVPIASVVLNIFNRGVVAADWRTSATIFSPFNILASTMHFYVVPHAAKATGRDLIKWIRRYQLSLLALSLGSSALLGLVVWSGVISRAFGEPWTRVQPHLLLLFVSQIMLVLAGGQFIGLRLRGRAASELHARALYAVGIGILVPIGTYVSELKGAFLGASFAGALAALYAAGIATRHRALEHRTSEL